MRVAIFSDLHLNSTLRPAHESIFINSLRSLRSQNCDELWLLGDIFDFMLGPFDFWTQLHAEFFSEIQNWIKENRKVLWIQGNHDFYLEGLLSPMGIEVSDSEIIRQVGSRSVYLAHGDLINSEDHAYMKWRRFTRSRGFREYLGLIPEVLRKKIIPLVGKRVSDHSRKASGPAHQSPSTSLMFREYAQSQWENGHNGVCLGHSHQEELIEELIHGNKHHFYLNLGSWINYSPRYALWDTMGDNSPKIQTL